MIFEINNFDLIWFNPFFNKLSFLRSDPPLKKTISEIAKIPGWGIEGSEQSIPLRLNKKQKKRKRSFLLLQINGHTSLQHWGQIYGKGIQPYLLQRIHYSTKIFVLEKQPVNIFNLTISLFLYFLFISIQMTQSQEQLPDWGIFTSCVFFIDYLP